MLPMMNFPQLRDQFMRGRQVTPLAQGMQAAQAQKVPQIPTQTQPPQQFMAQQPMGRPMPGMAARK